jgi:hypothetical protein
METFSTLLLTSSAPITHVLSSGDLVELPKGVTFIFELSNTDIAQFLGLYALC